MKSKNEKIKLSDFLRYHTQVAELCVIRESGWIIASALIDSEDLFYYPSDKRDMIVKSHEWGFVGIVNENGAELKIPCHYIDI